MRWRNNGIMGQVLFMDLNVVVNRTFPFLRLTDTLKRVQ
jgi:hypothetical protein